MDYPPDMIARARTADLPVTQLAFVLAYVAGGLSNGAEAWRQTHPDTRSDAAAAASASRALTNVNVQAAISAELTALAQRSSVTSDAVLTQIAGIANDHQLRPADRLKALELLGRYLSMWSDRPEMQQVVINLDMGADAGQLVTIEPPQLPGS